MADTICPTDISGRRVVNRCAQCRKKLGIMGYKCRCEKDFCITHLAREEHTCTYDYATEERARLRQQIDVGQLSRKMEKIGD